MDIFGHWSLYIILQSNLKTYIFLFLLFVLIWCWSGENVIGQADFSSPPESLGNFCKLCNPVISPIFDTKGSCEQN